MNPERARFIASLEPHKQARIQAANNPLSLKRAAQWEANQIAGYDARESLNARKARQRDALIRQIEQKKTQREQARQYRANLATELEASRQYGEQNPAQPTGPSPEEQMAANRAAVKADNDYIVKMNKDYLAALSAEEAASRAYGEANPAKPLNGGMTASEELAKTRADYDAEAAAAKRIRDDAILERVKKRFAGGTERERIEMDRAAAAQMISERDNPAPKSYPPSSGDVNGTYMPVPPPQPPQKAFTPAFPDKPPPAYAPSKMGAGEGGMPGPLDSLVSPSGVPEIPSYRPSPPPLPSPQPSALSRMMSSTTTGRLADLAASSSAVTNPLNARGVPQEPSGFTLPPRAPVPFTPVEVDAEAERMRMDDLRRQAGLTSVSGPRATPRVSAHMNKVVQQSEPLRNVVLDSGDTLQQDAETKRIYAEIDHANYMNKVVPVDMGGGRVDMMPRAAALEAVGDGSRMPMSFYDRPGNVRSPAEEAMAQGDYKTALLLGLIPFVGFDPMAPQGPGGQVNPFEAAGAVPAVGPAARTGRAIGAGAEEAARAASGPAGRFAASEGTGVVADAIRTRGAMAGEMASGPVGRFAASEGTGVAADAIRTRGAVAGELANEAARGLNVNRAAAERAASAAAANPANASRTLRSTAVENAEAALQTRAQIDAAARAERMAARDADQALSKLAEPDVPNVDLRTPRADRFARLSPEEKATELMKTYDRAWQSVSAGRITNEQFNEMVANTLKGENGELFRKALDAKYPGASSRILGDSAPNPR
jgi:hypothetical protein